MFYTFYKIFCIVKQPSFLEELLKKGLSNGQVMSLGYVVSCDIRKIGENHGMRIIVQSQYPLSIVYSTIENAISSLDDFLSTMSVETFERNRSALLTNKRETSFRRMQDVGNLLWMEIVESTYNFRRTDEEMIRIEKISFQEIVDFYNEKIAMDGPGNTCRNLTL